MKRLTVVYNPLLILLLGAIVFSGCTVLDRLGEANNETSELLATVTPPATAMPPAIEQTGGSLDLFAAETALTSLYERVNPSVVHIRVVISGAQAEQLQPSLPPFPELPGFPFPEFPMPG